MNFRIVPLFERRPKSRFSLTAFSGCEWRLRRSGFSSAVNRQPAPPLAAVNRLWSSVFRPPLASVFAETCLP